MEKHNSTHISKVFLEDAYVTKRRSMQSIATGLGCSMHKVDYWMRKYEIPRRSRSDASYVHHNPEGDPFLFRSPSSTEESLLYGLGMGLYWGEGTKANLSSVRLGNSDPKLIKTFIRFLTQLYDVDKDRLRFGLQLFTDCSESEALSYWCRELEVKPSQFYKITVTISGSIGTYRNKNRYGVATVYFNNKKLRDILVDNLAALAQW